MAIEYQAPSTKNEEITIAFKFPFQPGSVGFPLIADPSKVIFYRIASLLTTARGEKVMNPDYGVNLHGYVFENITAITIARISSDVTRAIARWIPEVVVRSVVPHIEGDNDRMQTTLVFDIEFSVANQDYSMQLPVNVGING